MSQTYPMAFFPRRAVRKLVTLLACIAFLHHAHGESATGAGEHGKTDTPSTYNVDPSAADQGGQVLQPDNTAAAETLGAQSGDQENAAQHGVDPGREEGGVLLVAGSDEDELELDASSSIDIVERARGVYINADLRTGFFADENEDFTGETESSKSWHLRWRVAGTLNLAEGLRISARMAGRCSSDGCQPNPYLKNEIPTNTGVRAGDVTLDSLYLHWFRTERNDVAIGRLQTRFVARGGVFNKSLDRNDSNNVRVTWTDGLHATAKLKNGWTGHFIGQYNATDGAGNVRHEPLDFSENRSRLSYFLALENVEPKGLLVQRGVDLSWLPETLRKDGISQDGRIEDYWGLVGRFAVRWPQMTDGPRLRFSTEFGFAPQTPTKTAVGLPGRGDADGLAWNLTMSVIDFVPRHSLGFNYGQTGAGWLLSPQYQPNERLEEFRYVYKAQKNLTMEIRLRRRRELVRSTGISGSRQKLDAFVRITWRWEGRRFVPFWR